MGRWVEYLCTAGWVGGYLWEGDWVKTDVFASPVARRWQILWIECRTRKDDELHAMD